ncbi:hypothetical protein [Kibdelosporangium philippinense]|uniref:hypothetical protein n=1 Tax=Kibdelosporangium philippinense TaxID=211113 RepID=UPI0036133A36
MTISVTFCGRSGYGDRLDRGSGVALELGLERRLFAVQFGGVPRGVVPAADQEQPQVPVRPTPIGDPTVSAAVGVDVPQLGVVG